MIYLFYFGKRDRIKGLIPKLHIFGRNYIYNVYSSSNLTCLTSIVSLNWLLPWFHVVFQWISYINLVMVFELILVYKKTGAGGSWLVDLQLSYQAARSCISDSPCKSSRPHFLRGYTHNWENMSSIVQIAWRLYNIVSYETINEFYFSQKLNMTETVYIYYHWTTGWSFTK